MKKNTRGRKTLPDLDRLIEEITTDAYPVISEAVYDASVTAGEMTAMCGGDREAATGGEANDCEKKRSGRCRSRTSDLLLVRQAL